MKKVLLLLLLAALSTNLDARIRSKNVNPAAGTLTIKNVAGFAYDYTNFMISINANYFKLADLIIMQGALNAGIDEEIEFSGLTIPAAASIALWYPSTFPGSPAAADLVDFMQFGSAGHEYESIAAIAGLWTAGEYVMGSPPYMHMGGPNDEGASYWHGSTIGLTPLDFKMTLDAYPTPVSEKLTLALDGSWNYQDLSLSIVNVNGEQLLEAKVESSKTEILTNDLASGIYFLLVRNEAGIVERKPLIKR